jgi:hypothetical protein
LPFVIVPSLFSVNFGVEFHHSMPWEKTANDLWYWYSGEYDLEHKGYFTPRK